LEAINNVKSDKMRQQTNRLTIAAALLEDHEDTEAVTKIFALLDQMRNELWKEMDRLEKEWNVYSLNWSTALLQKLNHIADTYKKQWIQWEKVGLQWKIDGNAVIKAGQHELNRAKQRKGQKRWQILKQFLKVECDKEPDAYAAAKAVKMAEIATIQKMLKILHGLDWSGAVFNAISRITENQADELPEAGYTLIAQMNIHDGLHLDNYIKRDRNVAKFGRVAIKVILGTQWVWTSFDAFSSALSDVYVPNKKDRAPQQRYIANMRVFKSATAKLIISTNGAGSNTIAQANIEMWVDEARKTNERNIPGANPGLYDFGDKHHSSNKNLGCFQVHDYQNKQTVFAVNNLFEKDKHDVGIGNQPEKVQHAINPDWTGAKNSGEYKSRHEAATIQWYVQSLEAAAELTNKAKNLRYGSDALDPTPAPAKTFPCDSVSYGKGTVEHKKWCCTHQQKPSEKTCCVATYIAKATCCKYPDAIFTKADKTALGCA
jgi:hypothetical protein